MFCAIPRINKFLSSAWTLWLQWLYVTVIFLFIPICWRLTTDSQLYLASMIFIFTLMWLLFIVNHSYSEQFWLEKRNKKNWTDRSYYINQEDKNKSKSKTKTKTWGKKNILPLAKIQKNDSQPSLPFGKNPFKETLIKSSKILSWRPSIHNPFNVKSNLYYWKQILPPPPTTATI